MININCKNCSVSFKTWPCRIKANKSFCSKKCQGSYYSGDNYMGKWVKGYKVDVPPEARKRQGEKMRFYSGENCWNWKGDEAKYGAIHDWVTKNLGKPSSHKCFHCKKKSAYDWANVDHKYRRFLGDFMALCRSCHRTYDIKNGLRTFNHFRKTT